MGSILYLRDTTAAEPKPNARQSTTSIAQWIASTLGGGQDGSSVIYPLNMKTTKGPATNAISEDRAEQGATHYVWYKAWISPPLQGDQTISGTIVGLVIDMNEGNAAHNMSPRIRIYVWKGDDTGVRGTLLADADDTIPEADTTDGTKQTWFDGYALTSVAALGGDRIVIEIMSYDNNTKTATYTHKISFNDSGTASDSYIEFSQALTFQSEGQIYTIEVSAVANVIV